MISATLMCLALNVYFEARNEPYIGQLFVAQSTLVRTDDARYPCTVCDVVYQGRLHSDTLQPVRDAATRGGVTASQMSRQMTMPFYEP